MKLENRNRYLPDVGDGLNERTFQSEMVRPSVLPWIEQPNEFIRSRHNGPYVRSFVAVAGKAGKCQIALFCCAAMFQADDMINFAPKECVIFVDQTVLTESVSSESDQMAQGFTDGTTLC
jgi:hypothetical protein